MFGHQHSHDGGNHGHSHNNNNEMNPVMQRAFMNMRAMNNNIPPNLPPHLMEKAQEFLKNQSSAANLPIPLQFHNANAVVDTQTSAIMNEAIVNEDYSKCDIVKATQYGAFDRCKELIESGTDINRPDNENVFLLHWAAINNRIEIAKYFISKGAVIDSIGGELQSSPLHWAARHGHLPMVILLVNSGADPLLFDNEGFSTIHLATMFGHSLIVAYLLAKGIDPNMLDKNNATPLMFAAQRIHNRDPAQLLLTFNARINAQDIRGNTPLHYCIQFNNSVVLRVLLDKGASLEIKNNTGLDAFEFAAERKKTNTVFLLNQYLVDDKNNLPNIIKPIGANKNFRKLMTQFFPFLTLFYFGWLFDSSVSILYKVVIGGLFYFIFFGFKLLFFDKYTNKHIPIATATAIIFWAYVTWLVYFRTIFDPFSIYCFSFFISSIFSWYNFYKAYKTNPGIVSNSNRTEINQSILQFIEHNEYSLDQFCTSCVVRKPLRSKHCGDCDHCVSKFDHHFFYCPWVDNCIGEFNLKYFIGFLFWTSVCTAFYLHSSLEYFRNECMPMNGSLDIQTLYNVLMCTPWVTFFFIVAGLTMFWLSCLFICHIYQAVFAALTTNERMNMFRYKHFNDEKGNFVNPFNFGVIQNCADVFQISFGPFKPSQISWIKTHDLQDLKDRSKGRVNFSNV